MTAEQMTLPVLAPDDPPIHWPTLADYQQKAAIARLTPWVHALPARFPEISYRVVPDCWAHHPGIVELLQALYDMERGCYDQGTEERAAAFPTSAVDFMRAKHDIVTFLREASDEVTCGPRGAHMPARVRVWTGG